MSDVIERTVFPVDELEPHPFNKEIYNRGEISGLVDRIDTHGFKATERPTVLPDGTILSGHRRWRAAVELGFDTLPVEIVDIEDPEEQKRRILLANEYRDKTAGEKIREGDAWEQLEREKAKERKENAGGHTEKLPEGDAGETREKVGEKIGVSGRTYEKGKTVKQEAENGNETAQEQWEQLENGDQSIHGAYQVVKTEDKEELETPDTDFSPEGVEIEPWSTATTRDIEIEHREAESGDVIICVDGEDHEIAESLFESIFKT